MAYGSSGGGLSKNVFANSFLIKFKKGFEPFIPNGY